MVSDMQDAADHLRTDGWRQGCLIQPNTVQQITESSIDHYDHGVSTDTWLVVLTQDCDLVRSTNVEPFVELLALKKLLDKPSDLIRGQSARKLHIRLEFENQIHWFEGSIHDRFRVKKDSLCRLNLDTSLNFNEDELRLLRQWLARRYTRAAFPDYFEQHLASTKDPVKKLFKSTKAKLISTVYLAIDNEDAGLDEDYVIHVILAALAEDFGDTEKRDAIDEFEQQFITVFSNRPHIRFALKDPEDSDSVDVRVLPEEDITLSMLRKYKRFDADYRSVDDDTVSPPDSIDTE